MVTDPTAESWVESPATWLNPFDASIVRLNMWMNQPVLACLAWVTEADQQWDACTTQAVGADRGKVLSIQGLASTRHIVEIDLRESQRFGGILTALRLVIGATESDRRDKSGARVVPTRFGIATVATTAGNNTTRP